MFYLLRYGWEATAIYGVDTVNNKFLVYENDKYWEWVPMDEFKPIS